MKKVTIGGNRLGAGKKMTADMKTYNRSSHDVGSTLRTTMSAGTLVPFLNELVLPGDTYDLDIDMDVLTHPTVGPLFGSFKAQCDVFFIPMRLYNAQLHNNRLGVGLKMSEVKIPQVVLRARGYDNETSLTKTPEQINPSCIFSYMGIRGIGKPADDSAYILTREFNAIPYLGYWDIYKNYYANKQEGKGAVIHTTKPPIIETVTKVELTEQITGAGNIEIPENTGEGDGIYRAPASRLIITYTGTPPLTSQIYLYTDAGQMSVLSQYALQEYKTEPISGALQIWCYNSPVIPLPKYITGWRYATTTDIPDTGVQIVDFDLANIDAMRDRILAYYNVNIPFKINDATLLSPYHLPLINTGGGYSMLASQEGLALKTYQSDLFNNWLDTEWMDGDNGISAITAVDTSDGNFTIDTLNLSNKVYNMLNRIYLSGGSYNDWIDTVYTAESFRQVETPVYMGGLSKELVFQEVIASTSFANDNEAQPLGQLGGRGIMSNKHKGGKVVIKVSEPGYIMGIVSLTPRIDYSQGNKWDTNLKSMDDLHKPALDEIGYQDLITDQMAYWDTTVSDTNELTFKSAGKQPAWINYMTNVNELRGNFALRDNEGFMVLDRDYEQSPVSGNILDLTTYIDPAKWNYIFAETSRDSMNYWVQIGKRITARRMISAKIIPNL